MDACGVECVWAAGYAEDNSLLYLLFRSGEVYRYFDVPRGSTRSFWRQIPKGDTSDATFGGASATSGCASRGDDHSAHLKNFS